MSLGQCPAILEDLEKRLRRLTEERRYDPVVRLLAAFLLGTVCLDAAAQDGGSVVKVLPSERARMLPVTSSRAAEVLPLVLTELGFRLRVEQPKDGLFITKPATISRLRKYGVAVSPVRNTEPSEVEVHAFVSPSIEPAHVHVDAIVTTLGRHDGTRSHGYSLGEVERQVLDALQKWLSVTGHPIPEDLEPRRAAAMELRPQSEPCAFGKIQIPEVLPASKVRPLFPAGPMREGEAGKVVVLTRLLADGSVLPIRVLTGSGTAHSAEMEQASLAVVGLWRYRPALNGSCPFDVPVTIAVSFTR